MKLQPWMAGTLFAVLGAAAGYGHLLAEVDYLEGEIAELDREVWPRIVECERDLNFLRGEFEALASR